MFRAWTEADRLAWFGNPDAGHPTRVDLHVGGTWEIYLVQPDGECYWTGGTYREIVPDQRICFTWGTVGGWPNLDPTRPNHNPVLTVTLVDVAASDPPASQTELTLQVSFPEEISDVGVQHWLQLGIEPGWAATLDRLIRHLRHHPASGPLTDGDHS